MNEIRYRDAERRMWESVGANPTEQQLRLERLGVTVRVQEVGAGPTVLFVHGASNGGTSWAPLVALLEGFHCVMLDRPGCALSDARTKPLANLHELGAFADSLIVDVLDAMNVGRAHVCATSFGGYITLRSAAAHPERINRIVEFGYSVGATRLPLPLRLASVPGIGRVLTAVPPTRRTTRAMLRRIGLRGAVDSGQFSPAAVDWYWTLLRDTDTMRNELSAGPRFPLLRMDDRLLLPAALLAGIDAPVHFVWGDEDPFGGGDVARQFVTYFPDATLELMDGAGHAPWIDDPERAATSTRAFLGA